MIIRYTKALLIIILLITSCKKVNSNEAVDEGSVNSNVYNSKEIGWTITIPNDWKVTTKQQSQSHTNKGKEILENQIGDNINISGLKNLIGFQKNPFNSFQSTSEPFEIEYPGEWKENNILLKKLMYDTYTDQDMKTDTSATTVVNIDGLDFQTYEFIIYGPDGEEIIKQQMYNRLINGFDFGVNINYNNEADKKEMLDAWVNSKFKK
ncbi:hypothetical protein JBL43_18950 [Aureibaculum sp. A20]|uniref:DUF695 domain-containing protein n=1 Tax=Aureibaculum flavum TaxID=2795986 RepID=A0ABS0WWH1_9FLAO|nr:hypothetical protein [Aureibaculum flavum]MBJ2176338.1 hypothetical protein [Aureibaculum flavum]